MSCAIIQIKFICCSKSLLPGCSVKLFIVQFVFIDNFFMNGLKSIVDSCLNFHGASVQLVAPAIPFKYLRDKYNYRLKIVSVSQLKA